MKLVGSTLVSVHIEYAAYLELTNGLAIRIESPFTIKRATSTLVLDPEADSADVSTRLRELVGCSVVKAEVDDGGRLSVTFEGGAELEVAPDPWYESWTVTGPNGFMVVCMPGGQLATWKGDDPT